MPCTKGFQDEDNLQQSLKFLENFFNRLKSTSEVANQIKEIWDLYKK